ncbi:MAG: hypothetical protein F4Y01_08095 [Gammaproteobacteria bacterium]|nr:hypothetical protein [Gammaproteobacteria bacterium]
MATDWASYKAACDRPEVLSRWMLIETAALVEPTLRRRLLATLADPLPKPKDHRGGTDTDMFEVTLCAEDIRSVRRAVECAVAAGITTPRTSARGLGGFAEAWRELEQASVKAD